MFPTDKIIKLAIATAKKSSYRIRLGCVIYDKKKVISIGYNSSLKSARSLHPVFQKWKGSVHAEVSAVLSAKADLKRCSLLVVRIDKDDRLKLAMPCEYCYSYIKFIGIKEIFYSIEAYPQIIKLIIKP